MKSLFSEKYYRDNWDRFIKKIPGEHYMNLEEELEHELKKYEDCDFPEDAYEKIRNVEAAKIVEKATKLVMKEMATINDIESGNASFGYTTQIQETKARGEFRQRFEFNCLQLADFKKKHSV